MRIHKLSAAKKYRPTYFENILEDVSKSCDQEKKTIFNNIDSLTVTYTRIILITMSQLAASLPNTRIILFTMSQLARVSPTPG